LWLEDKPQNFIRTVLDGIDANDGLPGAMPAFRDKLSDDDLEALAAYLRITRTNAPGWPSMRELIRRTRIESMSPP